MAITNTSYAKLRQILADWYGRNKRDLPWRQTNDPYLIWLSEVILQQTRVDQGMEYYLRFAEKYPTVGELAAADEDEVLKLWQGLGYYNRARNMLRAARKIAADHSGRFPCDPKAMLSLPGIGPYTAAAVGSIAFKLPLAVVDGNVQRVLSRLFGVEVPIDTTQGQRLVASIADDFLDKGDPSTHNQALMEFGAIQCKPGHPQCGSCVFAEHCIAGRQGVAGALPVKSKQVKRRQRFFNYLVVACDGELLLRKRKPGDIWAGLFDFPLIESETPPRKIEISNLLQTKRMREVSVISMKKHVLTHQDIHSRFFLLTVAEVPGLIDLIPSRLDDLHRFAVPKLIDRFFKNHKSEMMKLIDTSIR